MIKQIIKVTLVSLLFISCNGQISNKKKKERRENKKQIENAIREQTLINFFDEKYFKGYLISFGDSDISEHPYRYYYDYENEELQWFTISYVPKGISLHNYWLNYFEGSNEDENSQSSIIEKIVNKDLSSYNIFAAYIPKKYLDISNGESEEAMFFKNNTEVYLYLYNLSEKKWKLLKNVKTNSPLIGKRDFFYKLFPELFSPNKVSKLNDNRNIDKTENRTLFKNFIFKFSTSKIKDEDGDEIQKIKIKLTNKESYKIQEIDFIPRSLITKFDVSPSSTVSYFDIEKVIIKSFQNIEGGNLLIALDVNFDGLEDFAIINNQGSNGGPQYAYYVQKTNDQFVLDSYMTENVRFCQFEIDKNTKTITIIHPSGCCQIQTYKFQIQPNREWKDIYSNLQYI